MSARDDADTILHLLTFVHALAEAAGSDISEIEMLAPPVVIGGEDRNVGLAGVLEDAASLCDRLLQSAIVADAKAGMLETGTGASN